jgi:hypothetical protein
MRKATLTVEQILRWADSHHLRTGQWPKIDSGPVAERPAELWRKIDNALRLGLRGLPGGLSLPRLLERERGVPARRGRRRSGRARQALELRRRGLTLKEIGRFLGVSYQAAWQMLQRIARDRRGGAA